MMYTTIWGGETMTNIITNSNIASSSQDSKGLIKEQNTVKNTKNNLRVEPLKKADQQTAHSLVERMINYQQDKVDPGISVSRRGTLDLDEGETDKS